MKKTRLDIISHHLLPEILLRLPLKSLIRFKLLSKECQALITQLVISNLNNNPTPTGLLLCFGSYFQLRPVLHYFPYFTTSPNFKNHMCTNNQQLHIVPDQSCNGLLIFRSTVANIYVCNLTTNKFLQLPNPPTHGLSRVIEMRLAFDPATCPYYTLVAIVRLNASPSISTHRALYQIYIYSSNSTGVWRLSGQPFRRQPNYQGGVYWNGAIHWIIFSRNHSCYYFDIKNETLKTMPSVPWTPGKVGGDYTTNYYFGESCGHLHFVETGFKQIHICEIKTDYSEWFVMHTVNMPIGDYNYRTPTILSVVHGEKKDGHFFLVLRVPGKVIRFDLVSGTCQDLGDIQDESRLVRAFHYFESISSV